MKSLSCKTGTYEKDGQTKGRYTRIGVLRQSNDGGEYMLLDPSVNLAGILIQQNAFANQPRTSVMVSVWDDSQQQAPAQQQQAPAQQQAQDSFNDSEDIPF